MRFGIPSEGAEEVSMDRWALRVMPEAVKEERWKMKENLDGLQSMHSPPHALL
jgi:hypothetical protein